MLRPDVPQSNGVVETARDKVVGARVQGKASNGTLMPLEIANKGVVVGCEISDGIYSPCQFRALR